MDFPIIVANNFVRIQNCNNIMSTIFLFENVWIMSIFSNMVTRFCPQALIFHFNITFIFCLKEMFGKCTSKWKTLVTQLKKRINLNPNTADSDMFSAIIESK